MFWNFLDILPIFLLPQVTESVAISDNNGIYFIIIIINNLFRADNIDRIQNLFIYVKNSKYKKISPNDSQLPKNTA